ncbi:putative membrane protein [Aliiruegeria haliotis]|uniref:Putative membrane protein n=1 Tax=Aliiruegeria haliotis TaxID=1280846 RepID=A0A2T0RL00_9RHOB|nr:hypothetical protein [Aliiruegeria haliotis]PRY21864.1 putative membrane protein [Aliiruegeria haliotis]
MDEASIARALHVFGVVLWIGGVGFVTTVLLPAVGRLKEPHERVAFFEEIEGRFARQAKATTLLVGLSGFYLVHIWGLWDRFTDPAYFWMHAMVAVWVIFSVMLFIAEPLFLHKWFVEKAQSHPERTFRLIQRMHWVLLTISLATVLAATLGSHGGLAF